MALVLFLSEVEVKTIMTNFTPITYGLNRPERGLTRTASNPVKSHQFRTLGQTCEYVFGNDVKTSICFISTVIVIINYYYKLDTTIFRRALSSVTSNLFLVSG